MLTLTARRIKHYRSTGHSELEPSSPPCRIATAASEGGTERKRFPRTSRNRSSGSKPSSSGSPSIWLSHIRSSSSCVSCMISGGMLARRLSLTSSTRSPGMRHTSGQRSMPLLRNRSSMMCSTLGKAIENLQRQSSPTFSHIMLSHTSSTLALKSSTRVASVTSLSVNAVRPAVALQLRAAESCCAAGSASATLGSSAMLGRRVAAGAGVPSERRSAGRRAEAPSKRRSAKALSE
mmetsp:Transcript_38003/g.87785  ORF Transcript_38003/g.87785 Transcript_38003/m.87785 type:complete len:235 (-) Transcript_38003:94-798(-)